MLLTLSSAASCDELYVSRAFGQLTLTGKRAPHQQAHDQMPCYSTAEVTHLCSCA